MRLLIVAALVLLAAGCARPETPIRDLSPDLRAYLLQGNLAIATEAGAMLAEQPATPDSVVFALDTAAKVAAPASVALAAAHAEYVALRRQIDALELAGLPKPERLTVDAALALQALLNAYTAASGPLGDMRAAIEGVKR